MPRLKRLRKSKPKFQDLDQYQSTSCSSEIGFERPPSKRGRQITSISGRKSSYELRDETTGQNSRSRVPPLLSDDSSASTSSLFGGSWKPIPKPDVKIQIPLTFKKKINRSPSALERKKYELELARQEEIDRERRREQTISLLSNRIIDDLVQIGVPCRDVARLCSERLGWDFTEWRDILKGHKVAVYEPIAEEVIPARKRSSSSRRKSISLRSKPWSPSLEVDALNYCIVKSEGARVELRDGFGGEDHSKKSLKWETVDELSELRCVFVHRSLIERFLSEENPSIVELTRIKPRLQIFAFGNGLDPASNAMVTCPKVDLILCAGAIIIPTFNSLFRKRTKDGQSGKHQFNQLKKSCMFHPFIKVCLHPSMRRQLNSCFSSNENVATIDVDFLVEFMASPDFDLLAEPETAKVTTLADWIKLDRNNICWLWSNSEEDQGEDEENEEILEVHSIIKTLKEIQIQSYTEFRKFIIALPEAHPYSNRGSVDGIELIDISQLNSLDVL